MFLEVKSLQSDLFTIMNEKNHGERSKGEQYKLFAFVPVLYQISLHRL